MDELRQFYPNIVETTNQNVHFIPQDNGQIRQNQEIYITTPDKVIVDNTQQQIIVNQTPYQNQYVIQETTMDNRQPIFYMDNVPMLVTQIAQPINICNTVTNNMQRVVATPVLRAIDKSQKVAVLTKTPRPQPQKRIIQTKSPIKSGLHESGNSTESNSEIIQDLEREEIVSLPDGRIIPFSEYKKLVAIKRNRTITPKPRLVRHNKSIGQKSPMKMPAVESSLEEQNIMPVEDTSHANIQHQSPNLYIQRPAPQSQNSCIIGPQLPPNHQVSQPCPPANNFPILPRSQIEEFIDQTPIGEEYSDSIRMLVLLATGEQRLITFTIPKEQCTIQEILEQIGIIIEPDTKIDFTESDINGINYVVAVGIPNPYKNLEQLSVKSEDSSSSELVVVNEKHSVDKPNLQQQAVPENTPKENPRYVSGKLAVCLHCGYLSEDFNKCLRCRRKLPEDVKSVSNTNAKQQNNENQKNPTPTQAASSSPTKITPMPNLTFSRNMRKRPAKSKLMEQDPIILTLSSDDEDDSNKPTSEEQINNKLTDSGVHLSAMKKEPSISDIQQVYTPDTSVKYVADNKNITDIPSIAVNCRTIRIGSYRFIPSEDVVFCGTNVIIKVPHIKNNEDIISVTLSRDDVIRVLYNFQKILPVIFYYVSPNFGKKVRELIGMTQGEDNYFDPLSKEEAYKRLTILPEYVNDEAKMFIKQLYGIPFNLMAELTNKEANNILMKTCPKEVNKIIVQQTNFADIRQLLIYPPGKGGLSINTEDYMCLAQDQFLNDVIIDFYLKYLVTQLPLENQRKVHVFSTFFYNRLTTKPSRQLSRFADSKELDPNLTPAEKRHMRVSKWTKKVNLFEKDFIIIPINENSHWFLAIICFAGIKSCTTFDGKPVTEEKETKKEKNVKKNANITKVKLEREAMECEEEELSNKDEAESDESESEESDVESEISLVPESSTKVAIKQPCILIFDSLACTRRSRVIATLRDYLTVEYKSKFGTEKLFTKDNIKGSYPKVPQQTNFTDCGLYLLQFVESFFEDPILDYHLPIKTLKSWFDEITVTKKREDIANLIKDLMGSYNKDTSCLPEILFPTINGKLRTEDEEEEDAFGNEDEMADEDEHLNLSHDTNQESEKECATSTCLEEVMITPVKITNDNTKNSATFLEQNVIVKSDLSEIHKQSNRETLSYLKAKRINRHKGIPNETDAKKQRVE